MKKITAALLLLLAQYAMSQQHTDTLTVSLPPDSTGFGKPDGNLTSKTVGAEGGIIVSEDGVVELNFPAGALEQNTTISIQPTTNPAPNGFGKSYQFEPAGIHFKVPVDIRIRYTEEEKEDCPPELMSFALQDERGKWTILDFDEFDSTARLLKGKIEHFSYFSKIADIRIAPNEQRLKTGKGLFLYLIDPRQVYAHLTSNQTATGYVNGIPNGNAEYGTLHTTNLEGRKAKWVWAEYTAPVQLPKSNPVIVSFEVAVNKLKNGKLYRTVRKTLNCKVTIYDEYKIEFTGLWDNTNLGMGTTRWTDTSSIRFQLETISGSESALIIRYKPSDVHNTTLRLEKLIPAKGCTYDYMNKEYCKGIIHISEVEDIDIVGRDKGTPKVSMKFKPVKAEFPILRITCKKMNQYMNIPVPVQLPAVPFNMNFLLKEGEQVIFSEKEIGLEAKLSVKRSND